MESQDLSVSPAPHLSALPSPERGLTHPAAGLKEGWGPEVRAGGSLPNRTREKGLKLEGKPRPTQVPKAENGTIRTASLDGPQTTMEHPLNIPLERQSLGDQPAVTAVKSHLSSTRGRGGTMSAGICSVAGPARTRRQPSLTYRIKGAVTG